MKWPCFRNKVRRDKYYTLEAHMSDPVNPLSNLIMTAPGNL
jgi:hypothetical protein